MRIAAAFILLISLAMAFKLEKEHPVFEDDPHEQYSPDEQYEPDEQDEPYELDEPAELYELDEPAERIEQEEDEDGNKVIEQFTLHCRDRQAFAKLPDCFSKFLRLCPTLKQTCYFVLSSQERSLTHLLCVG